jgi:hypothetical protein
VYEVPIPPDTVQASQSVTHASGAHIPVAGARPDHRDGATDMIAVVA